MFGKGKVILISSAALALWVVVATGGLAYLTQYDTEASVPHAASVVWPRESALLPPKGRPALVLFLHPKCPCSRATVAELTAMMTDVGDQLSITVLLLQPDLAGKGWLDTGIVRTVAAMANVAVRPDLGGKEAAAFRATTSGEVFVYDAGGSLQFHGGITSARGHVGNNTGRRAVQAVAICGASNVASTPIFGCPLQSTRARPPPR